MAPRELILVALLTTVAQALLLKSNAPQLLENKNVIDFSPAIEIPDGIAAGAVELLDMLEIPHNVSMDTDKSTSPNNATFLPEHTPSPLMESEEPKAIHSQSDKEFVPDNPEKLSDEYSQQSSENLGDLSLPEDPATSCLLLSAHWNDGVRSEGFSNSTTLDNTENPLLIKIELANRCQKELKFIGLHTPFHAEHKVEFQQLDIVDSKGQDAYESRAFASTAKAISSASYPPTDKDIVRIAGYGHLSTIIDIQKLGIFVHPGLYFVGIHFPIKMLEVNVNMKHINRTAILPMMESGKIELMVKSTGAFRSKIEKRVHSNVSQSHLKNTRENIDLLADHAFSYRLKRDESSKNNIQTSNNITDSKEIKVRVARCASSALQDTIANMHMKAIEMVLLAAKMALSANISQIKFLDEMEKLMKATDRHMYTCEDVCTKHITAFSEGSSLNVMYHICPSWFDLDEYHKAMTIIHQFALKLHHNPHGFHFRVRPTITNGKEASSKQTFVPGSNALSTLKESSLMSLNSSSAVAIFQRKTTPVNVKGPVYIYLDKHEMTCSFPYVMRGFSLRPSGATKMFYEYYCDDDNADLIKYQYTGGYAATKAVVRYTAVQDQCNDYYLCLDRHRIQCPPDGLLTNVRLIRVHPWTKIRYRFKCTTISPPPGLNLPPKPLQCVTKSTPANSPGSTKGADYIYLDRHKLLCSPNSYLQGLFLYRPTLKSIAYAYTCCTMSNQGSQPLVGSTHNSVRGGAYIYLDRHEPACPGEFAMSQFQMRRAFDDTIYIGYTCQGNPNVQKGRGTTQYTAYTPQGGNSFVYLDRQHVWCPPRGVLRAFRLLRDPPGRNIRYKVQCEIMNQDIDCVPHNTPANADGAAVRHEYLDKHNVACPANNFLRGFNLRRPTVRSISYHYQCCKPRSSSADMLGTTPHNVRGATVAYLDRHEPICPHQHAIAYFRLLPGYDRTIHYSFRCKKMVSTGTSQLRYTPLVSWTSRYIDMLTRLNVDCAPVRGYVQSFRLSGFAGRWRYNYRCMVLAAGRQYGTCRSISTPLTPVAGSQDYIYLDRQFPNCGAGESLRGFRLIQQGSSMFYRYTCCS